VVQHLLLVRRRARLVEVNVKKLIKPLLLSIVFSSCASQLAREEVLKDKTYREVNYEEIFLRDVNSSEDINLLDYFKEKKLKHLLLMYGARSCSDCQKKNVALRDIYMPSEKLFLDSSVEEFQFEMIGVMSDSERDFPLALRNNQRKGFDFIRWADFGAEVAKGNFIENPDQIQIPFTVLLTPKGVAREWGPKVSVTDILTDVKHILGLTGSLPSPVPENPEQPTPPSPRAMDLSVVAPGRFERVMAQNCSGREEAVSLSSLFSSEERGYDHVGFLYASKDGCDEQCRSNLKTLEDLKASCLERGFKGCEVVSVSNTCTEGLYKSETDFHKVFETHFNSAYEADFSDFPAKLPEVQEDILMGFNLKTGRLVFSKHDQKGRAFVKGQLLAEFRKADMKSFAPSQTYSLVGGLYKEENLSKTFSRYPLTVMLNVNYMCSGCIDELKHWHKPGELVDFCRESAMCAVHVADFQAPEPDDTEPRELYQRLLSEYQNLGIAEPNLLVDFELNDEDRFYAAYIEAYFRDSWDGLPGVSIFDGEGKVVYSAISSLHTPDPTLEFVKEYAKMLQSN
jgi:hypothetical protein